MAGVPLGPSSPSSTSSSVSKVLMRMQQFGDIVEHSVSDGNWMFIKYVQPLLVQYSSG